MKIHVPEKFILVILFFLSIALNAGEDTVLHEINSKTTSLSNLLADAYAGEFTQAREIAILDNEQGKAVAAVSIFTIEGFAQGNNHTQFLAFFARLSKREDASQSQFSLLDVMAIGGKGRRRIDAGTVQMKQEKSDTLITVSAFDYAPGDAICCPTAKTQVEFAIKSHVGGRLREVDNQSARQNSR